MKLSWLEWLPFRRWRIVGTVEFADDIPQRLPKRAMVLVVSGSSPKWAGFNCPCGKGHEILLNLDQGRHPAWSLTQSEGKITIAPSIDYLDGRRRCHFILRNSKILWAKDSTR